MASSNPSRSQSRSGSTDLEALKRRLARKPRGPAAPLPPDFGGDDTELDPLVQARVARLMREVRESVGSRLSITGPAGAMVIEGDGNIQIAGSHIRSTVSSSTTTRQVRTQGSLNLSGGNVAHLADDGCRDPACEVTGCRGQVDHYPCQDPSCDDCNPGVNDRRQRENLPVQVPTKPKSGPERKGLGFWGFMAAATVALVVVNSAPWWITLTAAVGVVYVLRKDRLRLAELETRAAEAQAVESKDKAAQAELAAADPVFAAEFEHRPRH